MQQTKILVVIGTRPEAIKMAPLVHALLAEPKLKTLVCLTAQHRQMLDQVLEIFGIEADIDLNLMKQGQQLAGLTASVLTAVDEVLATHQPDCVLVHGDTTTAMAAGLAAFYRHIRVGHVEAGLRTYDMHHPWPEEMNRRVIDVTADFYFAPTNVSRANLLAEKIAANKIFVTGNTVIDALLLTTARIKNDAQLHDQLAAVFPYLDSHKKLILVTGHRRENHGDGLTHVCRALAELAKRDDVQVVYPVHLNPNVREVVNATLQDHQHVYLIEPQDYLHFVYLMNRAHVILTDSGGIQEEAPSLGKPVLVLRDVTERPEAVDAGTVQLVGTDTKKIVAECTRLLDDDNYYRQFSRRANPYGDGTASQQIVASLLAEFVVQK
ncbi:MAG: UDP-N-acetylglucosamine 2-epimerase (non-hydrolyzing) [Gallionella sp.]